MFALCLSRVAFRVSTFRKGSLSIIRGKTLVCCDRRSGLNIWDAGMRGDCLLASVTIVEHREMITANRQI